MSVSDFPQAVWGYIFLGSFLALLIALRVTDRRRDRHAGRNDRGT